MSATEVAVARRLFSEAVQLERESQWQLAATKLQQALELKDTPGLRFHLAHCEERLGKLVEASLDYERAQDLINAGAKAKDVEQLLAPARSALEKRVPTLSITVRPDVAGLEVELDGQPLAHSLLGQAAPVNPAVHHLLVRAPQYRDYAKELQLVEGEHRSIQVDLTPLAAAAAQPARVEAGAAVSSQRPALRNPSIAPQRAEPSPSAKPYVLVGESALAAIALGVGVGFALATNAAVDRFDRARRTIDTESGGASDACLNPASAKISAECHTADDARHRYDNYRTASIIGFVSAGAGAVATLLTFALWPSTRSAPRVQATLERSTAWVGIRGEL